MTDSDAADLARACRAQAQLASTSEARKALIELAERYENGAELARPTLPEERGAVRG